MAERNISRSDYAFAIICATAMLDETHPGFPSATSTQCAYTLGRIGGHNIVLASLPAGVYVFDWAHGRYWWWSAEQKGDVVVSKPTGTSSGVIQYDFGKTISGGHFQHTGTMNQPPTLLLTAIAQLEASEMMRRNDAISESISHVPGQNPKAQFSRPQGEDRLFYATYGHLELDASCINCDAEKQVSRTLRWSEEPQIHYGTIASGNQVIKDGHTRDRIAGKLNALCFEMEAAGIMNHLSCLVIRGIFDYCDLHKNKHWQGYAALTAAAYAKLLLSIVPVSKSPKMSTLQQACWIVSFDQNPQFIGRDGEIDRLEKMVLAQDRSRKAAIAGLGGVGKTQIALELAYRIRDQDPKRSIFWIRSTSMEAVEKSFADIYDTLGLQSIKPDDVKSQVKAYLSSERAGLWLLIVDNADEADMWMSSKNGSVLKAFLPRSRNGFTVFTTRNQQLANSLVGREIIKISELNNNLAIDLLKSSLVEEDLMKDNQSAKLLIHQLGGLPLALTQAASYINQNSITLKG